MEKNSKEMKTKVETFIIEETAELIYDGKKLEQWNKKVAKLGLAGQTEIINKDKSPIPFMHLKKTMKNVFATLCPREVTVEEYNITPIPLEILDLIALAKKEKYFQKIIIRYDDEKPDPVCMGLTGYFYESTYYTDSNQSLKNKEFNTEEDLKAAGGEHPVFMIKETYLIGKWADVKHSFETLIEMAKKRYIKEESARHKSDIKISQRYLDDIPTEAETRFGATI